jgi:hypothetical protein
VCTSLELGAIQLVVGFQFLGWIGEDASEDKIDLTIWGITVIVTISSAFYGLFFITWVALFLLHTAHTLLSLPESGL